MDERQQQIQVGAGLQESRLNTELIAWLEKYGTWFLAVVLVVVVSYVGWTKYREYQEDRIDAAFAEYQAARGSYGPDGVLTGRPDNLIQIARTHAGWRSVAELAMLDAADIYLGAARRGLLPGTDLAAIRDEDILTPEQTEEMLASAQRLYERIAADTAGKKGGMGLLNLRANLGLASIATDRGEFDRARSILAEVERRASAIGFTEFGAEAARRATVLASLPAPSSLPLNADLPALPGSTPEQLDFSLDQVDLQRLPEGFTPPGFASPVPLPGMEPAEPREDDPEGGDGDGNDAP